MQVHARAQKAPAQLPKRKIVKWYQTDLGRPRGHVAGENQRPHAEQETNMPCRVTVTTVWKERVLEPWEDTCAESQPVPVRFGVWLCIPLWASESSFVSWGESNPTV